MTPSETSGTGSSDRSADHGSAPYLEDTGAKWFVLLAIGTGTFMSALDASIVNTVLPVINRSFGTKVATIEWVLTTYLLVVSGLLLSFGRLGDMRGHKRTYVAGFVVFVLASAVCTVAPSAVALIALRGLQALGAAMLFSNSPAILTKTFPGSQRGQALGMLATMTYLGLTIGPSLGGWITEHFTWRAVFAINVPVGLAALGLSLRFIPDDRPREQAAPFDIPGALSFIAGMVLLLLALNQGHAWGWGSPLTRILFLVAVLILVAFILIQVRSRHPMLDLTLFRSRTFSAAVTSALLNYICIYTVLFLLPFYLIQGRGLSPSQAGLILTAQPLAMAIFAPISGILSDRIGQRVPTVFGMTALAIALFLLSRLGPGSPIGMVALLLALVGFGTGVFISPNNSALMGAAPRHRQGIAAGILATARNAGMVLGVGLAGAIFTTILTRSRAESPGGALYEAIASAFLLASGIALLSALTSTIRDR